MKYTVSVEINQPLGRTIALFDNEENMFKWMDGLIGFDHIIGDKGEVGAKSRLRFKRGKREMAMIETIELKQLPEYIEMTYEAGPVFNRVISRFSEKDQNTTIYESENEFIFKSWGMKAMAFFMPGAFKKQSQKYLKDFKKFAETQVNNEDS